MGFLETFGLEQIIVFISFASLGGRAADRSRYDNYLRLLQMTKENHEGHHVQGIITS